MTSARYTDTDTAVRLQRSQRQALDEVVGIKVEVEAGYRAVEKACMTVEPGWALREAGQHHRSMRVARRHAGTGPASLLT